MAKLWHNQQLVPLEHPILSGLDRGFTLGDGIFETMRADQGHIAYLSRHFDRLETAAHRIGCPLPYSRETLNKAFTETLEANDLHTQIASLRLNLSRGVGPRGIVPPETPTPSITITAAPCASSFAPFSLRVAKNRRNELSQSTQIKSLCYLDNILAQQDAQAAGADDALFLNTKGHVAETTTGNLFLIHHNTISTPPIEDGLLPGIIRAVLIEKAPHPITVKTLSPTQLETCDSAFVTNSLWGIRPVRHINDHRSLETQHPIIESLTEWLENNSKPLL